MNFDVTVVIPTFNAENFILEALSSVTSQSFNGTVEIIVIDDCSKDSTLELVNEFSSVHKDKFIKVLRQPKNMRQGTARNKGIMEANGNYILFLDADDFLDEDTITKLFEKAEKEKCDFVICDWAYYYEEHGLVYVNNEDFLFQDLLIGKEIESLYKANTYFSVNKLYRRSFLLEHNIKYGEGYIYEDFEFYIQVAQYAQVVGVIQNPFYRVRVNNLSTTKTNSKSTLHVESLIKAINNSLKKFNPRGEYSYYHVYKYLIRKSLQYLEYRAPKSYKRKSLKKVLVLLNNKKRDFIVPKKVVPLYHFLFRRKYVQESRVSMILLVWWLHSRGKLNPIFSVLHKLKWTILNSKIGSKLRKKRRKKKIESFYERPIDKNMILFLGFDYRYVGNSKYFFDYLKEKNYCNVYFVTKDKRVPLENRITPRSLKFYEKLSQAYIVIFESWVPLSFKKREESKWIQLWHGTPFKKLLFDSHEYFISSFNRNHKRNKQKDIRRWDYLLSDSIGGLQKLSSSFAIDKSRILNYGYPRVQWLINNKMNVELQEKIKRSISIPNNKKIVLYVPTWRDYNYKSNNPDLSYLMDMDQLVQGLGEDYIIIYKDHSMGLKKRYENVVIPNEEVEIQELILISDIVISDYSSIIFDALSIDIPFYLYINDFDKYETARGVYSDMDDLFSIFYVKREDKLSKKILEISETYPNKEYKYVKELYSNTVIKDSNKLLENKIRDIIDVN